MFILSLKPLTKSQKLPSRPVVLKMKYPQEFSLRPRPDVELFMRLTKLSELRFMKSSTSGSVKFV